MSIDYTISCVEKISRNETTGFREILAKGVDHLKVFDNLGFRNGLSEKQYIRVQKIYFTHMYETGLLQRVWIDLQKQGINPLDHYFYNYDINVIKFINNLVDMPPLYVPFDKKILEDHIKDISGEKFVVYSLDKNIADSIYLCEIFKSLLESDKLITLNSIQKFFPHLTHKMNVRKIIEILKNINQ